MNMNTHKPGKVVPVLLVVIIFMAAAFAAGYYVSWLQFSKKTEELRYDFSSFEARHEKILSSLRSDVMDIKAHLEEYKGKAETEARQLRMKSIMLKAKGEIISSKLSLSRNEEDRSIQYLSDAIGVLKEAYDVSESSVKQQIEDIRLQLATIKGLIQVDSEKAQQELDKLWRRIDEILN